MILGISDAIYFLVLISVNPRSMYARILHMTAQFVLKIENYFTYDLAAHLGDLLRL